MQKYYPVDRIGWGAYPLSSGWGHALPNGSFVHGPAPAAVASARVADIARFGGSELDIWCVGESGTGEPSFEDMWAPWIPALKRFLAHNSDDNSGQ